MSKLREVLEWIAGPLPRTPEQFSDAGGSTMPPAIAPRRRDTVLTTDTALSLTAFYRGVQIHATSICQLSVDVLRNGTVLEHTPALIRQPDLTQSRSAFLEYSVVSLYVDGNAFWLLTYAAPGAADANRVVDVTPLDPREVGVFERRDAFGQTTILFHYRGKDYTSREMKHLKFLRVPGMLRGLGPVQAARLTFEGALEVHEYGATWLRDAQHPDGVLTTDQELAPGDTERYKHVWYGRDQDGNEIESATPANSSERLRVLGKGLKYEALTLKPEDVQFLETQRFNTLDITRLIGAPASLMLVAAEGSSQSYQNVEQEWIGYVRFTLMKPIREIEEAFSELLVHGQKARLKIESLFRSDTKTRYEGHNLALEGGWQTADEVRAIEGMAPLSDAQRAQIIESRPAKTTKKEADA